MWIHAKTNMIAEVVEYRIIYVPDNKADAWKKKFEQMTPKDQYNELLDRSRSVKSLQLVIVRDINNVSIRDHNRGESI